MGMETVIGPSDIHWAFKHGSSNHTVGVRAQALRSCIVSIGSSEPVKRGERHCTICEDWSLKRTQLHWRDGAGHLCETRKLVPCKANRPW